MRREFATPNSGMTTRESGARVERAEKLYTLFANAKPSTLPYVMISILALVDSESDRTILGMEGRRIIERLELLIETSYSAY